MRGSAALQSLSILLYQIRLLLIGRLQLFNLLTRL
jgi:hypothetical protein